MKKIVYTFICSLLFVGLGYAYADDFVSCGPGYILVESGSMDGIDTAECQKLWCRDLETGGYMGSGDRASSGYKDTEAPVELYDNDGNHIECFGDRRWCSGEPVGIWRPEYGAYTKGGSDDTSYYSYQKGSCFAWRIEQPSCPEGQTAILQDGEWKCLSAVETTEASRESSVRRTGTLRRAIIR